MSKYQKLNADGFSYANSTEALSIPNDVEYPTLFLDNNYSSNNANASSSASDSSSSSININISSSSLNRGFPIAGQLFINKSHTNNNNNNSTNTVMYNNNYSNNNHNSCSSGTESDNTTQTALDAEESIMEVPLLHSDLHEDNPDYDDYEPVLHQRRSSGKICHCGQPGFASNLKTKAAQEAKCKILIAITLCCVFMIIEFLGGYIAGSLAIMTDAAHLASDCISFVIGLVAIWLGSRRPDRRMSFGYKRMEVMGAILSILGIWILTATLVMMAIERIYSNDFDLDANTMMTISGIGILINIAMVFILHGSALLPADIGRGHGHGHSHSHCDSHVYAHSHSHTHGDGDGDGDLYTQVAIPETEVSLRQSAANAQNGGLIVNGKKLKLHKKKNEVSSGKEKNMNLRAAMIHVIGDLVQSIGVFLAAILIKFFPQAKFADPLCTILFSFIVIMTTARLFMESVAILLDAVPKDVNLDELEMDLQSIDGVKSVHHLNVWQHTSNHNVLMVHLVIDLLTDSNTVLDKASKVAGSPKYNVNHSTIQIERLAA